MQSQSSFVAHFWPFSPHSQRCYFSTACFIHFASFSLVSLRTWSGSWGHWTACPRL